MFRGRNAPYAGRGYTNTMSDTKLEVVRRPVRLTSDPTRVIARLFIPGGDGRVDAIIERVLALSDDDVSNLLRGVLARYSSRHKSIERVFELHYGTVAQRVNERRPISADRRALLGAYFTSEYFSCTYSERGSPTK